MPRYRRLPGAVITSLPVAPCISPSVIAVITVVPLMCAGTDTPCTTAFTGSKSRERAMMLLIIAALAAGTRPPHTRMLASCLPPQSLITSTSAAFPTAWLHHWRIPNTSNNRSRRARRPPR